MPTLLSETPEERKARIVAIEQLAADLFQTAVTHLGRDEARRLLESVVKQRWTKGKQPDRERNRQLLERYDRELAKTPDKIREISRRLGKQFHPRDPSQAESLERRVRRLVKTRDRQQRAMEEAYRRAGPSLLEKASSTDK
jgi:hypothetical protein